MAKMKNKAAEIPSALTPEDRIAAALAAIQKAAAVPTKSAARDGATPDAALLQALYPELLPAAGPPALLAAVRKAVAEIAAALPDEQIACLRAADPHPAELDKVIIFRAALARVTGNTLWLHYNAGYHLFRVFSAGMAEARTPCLTHCLLALEQTRNGSPGPYLRSLIARLILPFAPREAIRNAIAAVQGGQSDAMEVVRDGAKQLGLIGPVHHLEMSVSNLSAIEMACGLPASAGFATVTAAHAAGVESEVVTEAGETRIPSPDGDAFYYMFRNAGQLVPLPAVTVHALDGGVISFDLTQPGATQFYVFDRDGACIEDLSWGVSPFIAADVGEIEGDLGIIGDRFCGPMNICHFMLDHLTRVALYDRFAPGAKILLADPGEMYRNIVARAGLSDRLVEASAKRFSIRAGRLLASSNLVADLRHPGHMGASWAIDFLRRTFAIGTVRRGQSRRVFISRADSKSRNILNWAEIEPLLSERGFEIMTLSHLSLAEQAALFAEAECVAGVHGAGLTNVIFAPPGLRVLEILPQMVASQTYWYLCHAAGHRYSAMVAGDPELPRPDYRDWSHQVHFNNRDIVIDPARFEGFLDRLTADPLLLSLLE